MSNPFSTNSLIPQLSNYPVAKGGPGSGRYPKQEAYDALGVAQEARKAVEVGSLDEAYDLHQAAAEQHQEIADNDELDPNIAQTHQDAADAHRSVVFSLRGMPEEASHEELKDLSQQALEASLDADATTDNNEDFDKSAVRKGGAGSGRYPKGSSDTATDLSDRAYYTASLSGENGADKGVAEDHRNLSREHKIEASSLMSEARTTKSADEAMRLVELAQLHSKASEAHRQASDAHEAALIAISHDPVWQETAGEDLSDAGMDFVMEAQNASDKAFRASRTVADATDEQDENPNAGSELGMEDLLSPLQISENRIY